MSTFPANVLVTGASRGIGAAIARTLAAQGIGLVLAARNLAACEELAHDLGKGGSPCRAGSLDVGDPRSIERLVTDLRAKDVVLDGLVNNAGIAESAPLVPREGSSEASVERHMAVNFHGARRLIEAVVPGMRERGYGRIVNVASSAGLRGYGYVSAYCASKFALVGYGLAAAEELAGSGVTLDAVCPHYVDSPMLEAAIETICAKAGQTREEARAFLQSQNPSGEFVTEDAVAKACLELLGDEDSGRLLELDGSERLVHRPNQSDR